MRSILKMTRRSIRGSVGRFLALTMIIALSVGFFSGLKLTKGAMVKTLDGYTLSQNMYDFRLVSSLGFTDGELEFFDRLEGITAVEGSISHDALVTGKSGERVLRIAGLPEKTNRPSLIAGRMPQSADECLVDADTFGEKNLGRKVYITGGNDENTLKSFERREFTLVGVCESPVYLGINYGVSTVGNGTLNGHMYILPECFSSDVYTDVYLTFRKDAEIYSDGYDNMIEEHRQAVQDALTAASENRYRGILEANHLTEETAAAAGVSRPRTYLLTRSENIGYVGFENDTAIVSSIANVFPFFFILVAMLVCVTTMTRMVSEERTQIGTLKAVGFSNTAITAKYLLYAGTACVLGWALGFFLGTWGIPKIFWLAYAKLYDFGSLEYKFSGVMCIATLTVSLAGIVGSAYLSCRRELGGEPASLIRPAAPKSGKRILLERIGIVWNRMRFIPKAVTRNIFRYKKRLVMMIIGIGGCTALLVTGFGVRDSLIHVGDIQYGDLHKYDYMVSINGDTASLENSGFVEKLLPHIKTKTNVSKGSETVSVQLVSFDVDDISEFIVLKNGKSTVSMPTAGNVAISTQAAEKLGVGTGDSITLHIGDIDEAEFTVSGIFENYIDNYIIVNKADYEREIGEWKATAAFLITNGENNTNRLMKLEGVSSVVSADERRGTLNDSLSCLDYIIIMVVFFAGALSFVVIYNLTNINLAERSREIATVKVLGFNTRETKRYILSENVIMAAAAGIVGLPMGVLLHRFVLDSINIDSISFPVRLLPMSMIASYVLTIAFALLVNVYMKHKVEKIPMAESLKTVE